MEDDRMKTINAAQDVLSPIRDQVEKARGEWRSIHGMDIEKLKDRLLEWDGVDAVDNGEFTEVNYHGVFELLREAANALEQLQAENDRLRRERTQR